MANVEEMLYAALASVNEELGIVGLHLSLEAATATPAVADERDYILSCKGESVPHLRQQAVLTIGSGDVRVLYCAFADVGDFPQQSVMVLESSDAYDLLLDVVGVLLRPGTNEKIH
jgi:hypothetical protein